MAVRSRIGGEQRGTCSGNCREVTAGDVYNPVDLKRGLVLGMLATLGVVQQGHVAAQTPKTDTIDQKEKRGGGRFVSFKEGTLTLQSNADALLVWNQLNESTKTRK